MNLSPPSRAAFYCHMTVALVFDYFYVIITLKIYS